MLFDYHSQNHENRKPLGVTRVVNGEAFFGRNGKEPDGQGGETGESGKDKAAMRKRVKAAERVVERQSHRECERECSKKVIRPKMKNLL